MKRLRKLYKVLGLALMVPIMPIFGKNHSDVPVSQRLRQIEDAGGVVVWTKGGDGIVLAEVCPECQGNWKDLPLGNNPLGPHCHRCDDQGVVLTNNGKALQGLIGGTDRIAFLR